MSLHLQIRSVKPSNLIRQTGTVGPGGRLQLVLMRHPPPAICQNLRGGGSAGGGGGIGSLGGGGAARNPLLSHAYLKGVSGV